MAIPMRMTAVIGHEAIIHDPNVVGDGKNTVLHVGLARDHELALTVLWQLGNNVL